MGIQVNALLDATWVDGNHPSFWVISCSFSLNSVRETIHPRTVIPSPYCWWKKSCSSFLLVVYPIVYRVFYIPGSDHRISSINSITKFHPKAPFSLCPAIASTLRWSWGVTPSRGARGKEMRSSVGMFSFTPLKCKTCFNPKITHTPWKRMIPSWKNLSFSFFFYVKNFWGCRNSWTFFSVDSPPPTLPEAAMAWKIAICCIRKLILQPCKPRVLHFLRAYFTYILRAETFHVLMVLGSKGE